MNTYSAWVTDSEGRRLYTTSGHATRQEAIDQAWARYPGADSVASGGGAHGWEDVQFQSGAARRVEAGASEPVGQAWEMPASRPIAEEAERAGRKPCREVAHGVECPGDCDPKVGDLVVCRDDSASFNRLRKGDTHTVVANFDGSPTVMVNGSTHCLERFQKVENVTAEVVNIGTEQEPKTRIAVDGVIVARGSEDELRPLLDELGASPSKARAIRDAFREKGWDILATTDGGQIIADLTDRELRALAISAWELSNTHDLEALRAEGRRRGMVTV